ncbi:MAG: hypothetical protein WBW32_09535 [Luteibacter sp.]
MDEMKQYAVGDAALGEATVAKRGWYGGRPLVAWLLLAYALVWVGSIVLLMFQMDYLGAMDRGLLSPLGEVVRMAFPISTLIGALLFFFMRKTAMWILGIHAIWSVVRIVTHSGDIVDAVISVVVTIYIWRLAERGELR